jgi:capsular exopolysaccharide synthesis family protein
MDPPGPEPAAGLPRGADVPLPDDDTIDSPSGSINVNEGIHESIVPFYDRSSIVAEQYRSLRTRLLTQNPQNDHRILAITSAIPREGKSVTTSNLGVVLSEIRHFKVLCVDADFRRSRLAQLLDAKRGPGLADLLEGNTTYEEVVQPTVIPNLYFVGAGETRGRTAAELLSSQRASAVMRRFQADFHYTLVDTPPATTVTDVGIIGQMCNGVIMIVRLNFTPEPVARRALRLLRVNKIPILGCLLIGRDERAVGYGYAYDYYRYYGYYHARSKERKR